MLKHAYLGIKQPVVAIVTPDVKACLPGNKTACRCPCETRCESMCACVCVRASFRASDTHTHWYTHTLVHSGTHTHTHTHARTNAHTHKPACAGAPAQKRTHTHTQAGTHTHGNETACLLLAGEQQTSLNRRGTRAPVSLDRLHLHQRRSSSVMTTNYHRSSGRKGSPSNRDPGREEEVDRFWCTWSGQKSSMGAVSWQCQRGRKLRHWWVGCVAVRVDSGGRGRKWQFRLERGVWRKRRRGGVRGEGVGRGRK